MLEFLILRTQIKEPLELGPYLGFCFMAGVEYTV